MGLFFRTHNEHRCALCGEGGKLTGEHKIKASALREELGSTELYIGSNGAGRGRVVQGAGSKYLKFNAGICEACNTARTQQADREFEVFNRRARERLNRGDEPAGVFELPEYAVDSDAYLNVFRYFGKLLCCHMAAAGAPIPKRLASFVLGLSDANWVCLAVQRDWVFDQMSTVMKDLQYAAHGGLTFFGHRRSGTPNSFYSSLTIGPLQYVFFLRLAWIEQIELRLLYPSLHARARGLVSLAKQNPMSELEKRVIGISEEGYTPPDAEPPTDRGPET